MPTELATDPCERRACVDPSAHREQVADSALQREQRPIRVLLFSTLYPSAARPGHGVFVETRLHQVMRTGAIDARVVAPVPWFPSTNAVFGSYAAFARTPEHETRQGIWVGHPRYVLPPIVGMTAAPALLALGAARTLARLIADGFDFDLIDAHYCYPDGVAAALLARWFGKPYVITARGSDLNLIARYRAPRAMMHWAATGAAANIAVSAALAKLIADWGVDGNRIHVLRNGVDPALFTPIDRHHARQRLRVTGSPVLLSVGHLVSVKRHHLVIETLATLLPDYPDAQLLIVGDGPLRDGLQSHVARLGLTDHVHFAGARPQGELALWYSAADLLVLASEREGWPNVVLEALACGTPVVASRVGGLPEILSRPALGTLVDGEDITAFAAGIRDVLRRALQRPVLRAHAESMGWQPTSAALVQLFRRAIEPSRGTLDG